MAVRRAGMADAAAMQHFVRRLSSRTRVERFFSPINELSRSQLERLLGGRGLCLAAFDDAGALVAHAQYAPDEGRSAEFGIVLADAWQARGLGRQLLGGLIDHARRAGISNLNGVALSDNGRMRRLASRLGFALKPDDDPQLVRMQRWLGASYRFSTAR